MPRRLIDDEAGMRFGRHGLGDLVEMPVHGVDVARGQDEGRPFSQRRAEIAPKIQAERVR